MRENKELPSGGTIESRIADRNKPKDIEEAILNAIKDWQIVKDAYIECEEESPTYMQMYAMKGALIIVDEFMTTLRELLDFLKTGEAVDDTETQMREATQVIPEPGSVPMKPPEEAEIGTAPPSETPTIETGPSDYYCQTNHKFDEATAKLLHFVCPKCRLPLRKEVKL